ncbi:MAG: hypothetical protein H5T72_01820 [Actinobacteria bacterium]|nr:hypothetical protein [Actinomycetota bacterium]
MARKYREMEVEQMSVPEASHRDYEGNRIHPATSVEAAARVFGPEAINIGVGNISQFNALYTRFAKTRTSLGIFDFGHLGTGIPRSIGAKLANPDREMYVIIEDGAAGFNFMEMSTAALGKVKITVIMHAGESLVHGGNGAVGLLPGRHLKGHSLSAVPHTVGLGGGEHGLLREVRVAVGRACARLRVGRES